MLVAISEVAHPGEVEAARRLTDLDGAIAFFESNWRRRISRSRQEVLRFQIAGRDRRGFLPIEGNLGVQLLQRLEGQ